MKKKILIGVMLSCFLLLVTPCINAIEYSEEKGEIESNSKDNISLKITSFMNLINLYLKIGIIVFVFMFSEHLTDNVIVSMIMAFFIALVKAIIWPLDLISRIIEIIEQIEYLII